MTDNPRRTVLLVAIAVGVIAAAFFAPAIGGEWIYDDRRLIAQNPYIHSFDWIGRWLTTDFWDVAEDMARSGRRMLYWRPTVTASYAVDWQVGGGSPLVFHLMNSLYHALAAALAFVVLRRWIGALWPAAIAALLFAVHPTKAESVAWIAGRTDVMCMIAVLLACEGIARRLRGQLRSGIALEVAGTVLAYTCKEQAIVLPVFAGIEAWVHAGRPAIDRSALKRIIIVALPQAALAIGYLAIRGIVMPIAPATPGLPLRLADHVLMVLETFGRFLTLTFYPHELSIQHGILRVSGGELQHSMPYVVIGALAVTALIAAAVVLRRRWPVATVGIAFFLVTMLPTSNLKHTQMKTLISERFLYLPVFGLALIAGAALAQARGEWVKRAYAIAIAVVLALGMLAMKRSADFIDEDEFWQRERELHWDSEEATKFMLTNALNAKRYQTALRLVLDMQKIETTYDKGSEIDIAFQVVQALAPLIPDHDTVSLRALDQFARDLLMQDKPAATLDVRGVKFTIGLGSAVFKKQLAEFVAQLWALRADLNSRLGDDKAAVEFARKARDVCQLCPNVLVVDAITHARASDYAEADRRLAEAQGRVWAKTLDETRAVIDKARAARDQAASAPEGPHRLQARATELASLKLWGRAYDVLAPYKDDIKTAPRMASGFAELAYRAGEIDVAREVLAVSMQPAEIEATLDKWGLTMGWIEESAD